jgi:glycosyltransferase involved in cell wall biosynthesis
VFGHLRESKRIMALLAAFAQLRLVLEDVSLLVAGDFVSEDLERAAAPLLATPGVIRLPYCSERDFWINAHSVDACINLRYPSAGETSGITVRLMGIGKPVIVSTGEETSGIPETACLRVDPGSAEKEILLASMLLLSGGGELPRRMGRSAKTHVHAHHAADHVARRIIALLDQLRATRLTTSSSISN